MKNVSRKATAIAPSNIAFIKYWGKLNAELNIPMNSNISMNLSNLLTTTTVEFSEKFGEDEIEMNKEKFTTESVSYKKVSQHLDRIRSLAKMNFKAKVVSKQNFPGSIGLSSSASGYAALTVAGAKAAGLNFSEKELSILARQGSGSACRSIPDGFVEWLDGKTSETSYASSLYAPDYWNIADVIVVVSKEKKEVSSTEGHKLANSSVFFEKRLENLPQKILDIKKYMSEKNFAKFGELVEAEALELHAIYITSQPSLLYLMPGSLHLIQQVKKWRQDGLEVYFSLNTGQGVHLICERKNAQEVAKLAVQVEGVQKTIINFPANGARVVKQDLF